jgi:hypothetical protein
MVSELKLAQPRKVSTTAETHHGDKDVQQSAVPEPMRPGSLRRHDARVGPLILSGNLLGGQLRAIVSRRDVALEARAVRRWVELERLLEDDGLAAAAAAVAAGAALGGRRRKAHNDVLASRSETAPGRTLEGQEESRYHGSRGHGMGVEENQRQQGRNKLVTGWTEAEKIKLQGGIWLVVYISTPGAGGTDEWTRE